MSWTLRSSWLEGKLYILCNDWTKRDDHGGSGGDDGGRGGGDAEGGVAGGEGC